MEKRLSSRKRGTFIVKIDACQNGSWQGRVVWADENKTEYFRSTLELIRLIDGALSVGEMAEQLDKGVNF
jgi:hypothetical protein